MKYLTVNKMRPRFLTWLCIISITTGSAYIIMFIAIIIYSANGTVPATIFPGLAIDYLNAGYTFILTQTIFTALGLTAAIIMLKMKSYGFYLYALSKTILYFLPVIFIGSSHLTYPGLLMTSIFIIMYGIAFTRPRTNASKT
jgi:hypothetical protein